MAMALTQICMSAQANSCIELHLNAENGAHKHKSAARSVVREYQRINREGGVRKRERGAVKLEENLEIVGSLKVQTRLLLLLLLCGGKPRRDEARRGALSALGAIQSTS